MPVYADKTMRNKLWVYVFPGLMDLAVAAVLLFSSIRAVGLGYSSVVMGVLGSIWGISYSVSSFILSKIINRKNAAGFMICSCVSFILIGLFFNFCVSFFPLFILLFTGGLFSSFFFVGFQIFMGDNTKLPHYKGAGLYTLSWSSGLAFGSLAEGALISSGVFYSQIPVFFSSIICIPGILIAQRLNKNSFTGVSLKKEGEIQSFPLLKNYVQIAWIEIFSVTFITTGIRYLLPKMTISLFSFNEAMAGLAVFLFFIFQALSGYVASFFKIFRYRIFWHDFMKVVGIISLMVPLVFYGKLSVFIFAGLLGIYAGHAFYIAVFYAVNHEQRAGYNVGINESLVGIASVFGPFISGIMLNFSMMLFLSFPCFILVISAFLEHHILKRFKSVSN